MDTGYVDTICSPSHSVKSLNGNHASALGALRAACGETEWEHGGCSVEEQPAAGIFVREELVALAGYQIWGGGIAHLSVITHPLFRGRGFGRSAIAHLASVAIAAGLIPQYRTLEVNRASLRIAKSLGFIHYATSVAVRFNAGT